MMSVASDWIEDEVARLQDLYPFGDFRIVVAGSRGFGDYDLLAEKMDFYLKAKLALWGERLTVISGTAAGADRLGERYARERGLGLIRVPAPWDLLGRRAGFERNKVMARFGDAVVVFWDGKSAGTRAMIDLAKKAELPVRVVRY